MKISYILKKKCWQNLQSLMHRTQAMTQGKGQVWAQVAREPQGSVQDLFPWLYQPLCWSGCGTACFSRLQSCCPPGSFLAIEDSLKSRQLPDGTWEGSEPYEHNWDEGSVSQLPQQYSPMLAHKSLRLPTQLHLLSLLRPWPEQPSSYRWVCQVVVPSHNLQQHQAACRG